MYRDHLDLVHGECLPYLKQLWDGRIDLTVTSPPYDNLRTYKGSCDWSFEVFKAIAQELYRVTKKGGVVVWIVGDATVKGSETGSSFKQALYFKEIGFNLHDTMIWCKDSCPFPETNRYYGTFEYMFVFSKGSPTTFNPIMDRKNKYGGTKVSGTGRQPGGETVPLSAIKLGNNRVVKEWGSRFNYWPQPTVKNSKLYGHPAMFPEQLALDHISSWSNPGEIVLDPFMGSGTTGKMAIQSDRGFIGVERVDEYFQIAESRLAESVLIQM